MMSEQQILIAKLTSAIINQLNQIEDAVEREESIYSMLYLIKTEHNESFEKALIFLLKEGVVK